jgi:Spy/CpxP family protein refolding chaperone
MRTIGRNITVTVLVVTVIWSMIAIAGPGDSPTGRRHGPRYHSGGPGARQQQGRMWRGAAAAPDRRPGTGQDTIFQLIGRRLDLTDEQREQIRQIRQTHREQQQNARQAVADARKALQDAIATDAEPAEIRTAATALGTAIGEQAVVRANTLKAIKEILTDEQREELEKMKQQGQRFRERARDHKFREQLRPVRGRGPGEWGGAQGRRPRVGRGPNIDRFFEKRDADDDGRLTEEELQNPGRNRPMLLEQIFEDADTDKDGALTAEELQAWKDEMAQPRARGPRHQR